LIGDLPPQQKLQRMSVLMPQQMLGRNVRLAQMIAATDDQLSLWTRACALHAVGDLRIAEAADAVLNRYARRACRYHFTVRYAAGSLEHGLSQI
jgi:hypothetical protein